MERQRLRAIGDLALPIVGGMISQNIVNLVDTAMVGVLGDAALAAVGMGAFVNFTAVAFLMGLSAGVQAMAARRLGEGRVNETALPLNGGLILAASIALPWTIVLVWWTPEFFPWMTPDPAVVALGVPYLQWRLVGTVAVGCNFAFRGYWNGVSLSKLYLRTLVVMHVVNIFLNWVLIFGNLGAPTLGTAGAGIASMVSTYVGLIYYFVLGFTRARQSGFMRGLPSSDTLRTMLRLSIPAGIERMLFATGMTLLMWIVGRVGTQELAAANVLINVMLVAILPGVALGLACASLVGQALGRGEADDAKQWGWDVTKVAVVSMGGMGLVMLMFPDFILGGFLHNPETIDMARVPLRLVGTFIGIDAIALVLMNALLGAGSTRSVLIVASGFHWGLSLPLAWLLGPMLGMGLTGVWIAQMVHWVVTAVVFAIIWQRGQWQKIQV